MKKIFEFKKFNSLYLISFIIIFLLLTNSYFSYDESLIFGVDGYSFEISKASPNVTTERIQSIHSERFFYPYIIDYSVKY